MFKPERRFPGILHCKACIVIAKGMTNIRSGWKKSYFIIHESKSIY